MGKLSRVLLNSLFISAARAETFQVTSCNNENDVLRPPALTFRIAQDHFESNISQQTDSYTFIDGPDGGYQERTIQQDELSLSFDSETDDILLSYTLALQPTGGFQLNNDASIGFGEDSVVFQCRYARAVSATSQMTVTTPPPGAVSNTGDLTYTMSVNVGALGGDSQITISPNHNLAGLSPRLTSCRVNSGQHEIYPIHSFENDVCFDNTRLNVAQTLFGETIEFKMKTFRFTSGEASDSVDAQEQTISCDLHLEPSADIVQEQAADCSCYTQAHCQGNTIDRNDLKYENIVVYPHYELSIDLKLENAQTAYSNVLGFRKGNLVAYTPAGETNNLGPRIPAVWVRPGENKLHICSAVGTDGNHCWDSGDYTAGEWFNLQIKQTNESNGYVYQIFIDGELQHQLANSNPQTYDNVNGYMGHPYQGENNYITALGRFRNLRFESTAE